MCDLLGVSMITPTFGRCPDRQWLLEEVVEAFLRQDYEGPKELLILNDCPRQELSCETPGVRIINWASRFSSLGAKYNMLVSLARYNLIMPAEDDDISLPWRISQAVEHLGSSHYWNPQQLYYWEHGKKPVRDHGGVAHNASIYTKSAWLSVGGYPPVSGNQDALFDAALRRLGPPAQPLGADERPAYIYRWGVSEHLSGNSDHESFYRAYGERPVAEGLFDLKPHWRQDYVAILPT